MIERIIEFSIRNRFLVLIVTAALTIAGVYATLHTPVDAIPDSLRPTGSVVARGAVWTRPESMSTSHQRPAAHVAHPRPTSVRSPSTRSSVPASSGP